MPDMLCTLVTIRGVRPLLWHHFPIEVLSMKKSERIGRAGNNPEEWRQTVLATPDGQLYLDGACIFVCLHEGARYSKRGRSTLQSVVCAAMQVLDDRILIDRWMPDEIGSLVNAIDQPVYLDVRSVVNPATKGRNVRYRVAASPGWRTSFRVVWDKILVNRDEMYTVIVDAGRFSGLGDGRSIGLGRFEVESFEIAE